LTIDRKWCRVSSLQDQLLKAGLADKKAAKAANKQKRQQQKQKKQDKGVVTDEVKLQAQQALADKAMRSRELAAQHNAEVEKRAIAAQIKQLIELNKQARQGGEIPYNFTDGKLIKKIHVTAELQRHLVSGSLAIVKLGGGYELVPAQVADKIAQRDATVVLLRNDPAGENRVATEDDPYADYKIPDDLMW